MVELSLSDIIGGEPFDFSKMPDRVFVLLESGDDHGCFPWSKRDVDDAVVFVQAPAFADGAFLAVEIAPSSGYGVLGPIEAMVREHAHCLGYGAFYVQEKTPAKV